MRIKSGWRRLSVGWMPSAHVLMSFQGCRVGRGAGHWGWLPWGRDVGGRIGEREVLFSHCPRGVSASLLRGCHLRLVSPRMLVGSEEGRWRGEGGGLCSDPQQRLSQ